MAPRLLIIVGLLVAGLQGVAGSAREAAPPRGSLVVESTRDPMLHGELWVLSMRTGARQNLSRSPAADSQGTVSPDSRAVAFVSDRSGVEEVWVERKGDAVRRLAGPFGAESSIVGLQWSPSGAELGVVVSPRNQIRIIPRSGRGGRWVGRRARSFGWSPDGRRIAIASAMESSSPFVAITDRAGKPLARLPGYSGGWSSRGALLVLGPRKTWITDMNGRPRVTMAKAFQARWSPDGTLAALSGEKGLRLVAAGGRLRLRRPTLSLDDAGWAPDSRSLLVRDRSGRLARLFVRGSLVPVAGESTVLWSRSGALLRYDDSRSEFIVHEQGRTRRVPFPLPRGGCGGSFSIDGWLDGDRAVVTVGRGGQNPADLWIVDPDRGATRRFIGGTGWDAGPVWSPDGGRLAYEEREVHTHASSCDPGYQSSVAVALADGTGRRVLPPVDAVTDGPRWSPDGRKIVAVRGSFSDEEEFGIVVADAGLRAATRLTVGTGSDPSWSADGKSVIYQHGTSEIRRIAPGGGESTVIARGTQPEASPAAPLIAFVRGGAIRVIGLDGSGERRLVSLRPREIGYSPLRWSPDGRSVAVADASGIVLVSVPDGRVTRIARAGVVSVAWSPDGRRLAFAAPVGRHSGRVRTDAFVVSAAGGKPLRVTRDLADVGGLSWRP